MEDREIFFWKILPIIFEQINLYQQPLFEKIGFLHRNRIDIQDIIFSLQNVPPGQEANYGDEFIDPLVNQWFDTLTLINDLKFLKAVYFTRKTFQNIQNIYNRVIEVRNCCTQKNIRFCCLETPSRFVSDDKIAQWKDTIINQVICNNDSL